MLLKVELPIKRQQRGVEAFSPAHDWSGITLHVGKRGALYDEGNKLRILVYDHSTAATEPLQHLNLR